MSYVIENKFFFLRKVFGRVMLDVQFSKKKHCFSYLYVKYHLGKLAFKLHIPRLKTFENYWCYY